MVEDHPCGFSYLNIRYIYSSIYYVMKSVKVFLFMLLMAIVQIASSQKVTFKQLDQDRKVEVYIGNKFFTLLFIQPI